MGRLWRYSRQAPEGKYLVQRRDGTVPEWPWFVLGAKDFASSAALRAYADKAEELGYDSQYITDVRRLASEFLNYCIKHGEGDPDAPPHRKDDPSVIAKMQRTDTK